METDNYRESSFRWMDNGTTKPVKDDLALLAGFVWAVSEHPWVDYGNIPHFSARLRFLRARELLGAT
jgi:hypothetical protein